MAERHHEEEGRKGGAMEGAMGRYYEPTVTAVTDMVVPATRVQWGPVLAGVVSALAITFLLVSLGVALRLSMTALAYWSGASALIGAFLGSLLASRTAKAFLVPALVHGFMVWAILVILNTIGLGSAGLTAANRAAATGQNLGGYMDNLGWSFFIGAILLLIASLLGALVGMVPHREEHVEHT